MKKHALAILNKKVTTNSNRVNSVDAITSNNLWTFYSR